MTGEEGLCCAMLLFHAGLAGVGFFSADESAETVDLERATMRTSSRTIMVIDSRKWIQRSDF